MRLPLLYLATVLMLLNACGDGKPPTSSPATPAVSEPTMPAPKAEESAAGPPPAAQTAKSDAATEQPPLTKSAESTAAAAVVTTTDTTTDTANDPLELARKSGCMACHAIDKKVVGPAWKDVAIRYAGDPNAKTKLTDKVAKGGRGNWTDVVGNMAMPPYSPRVSNENIETLVEFVLSLNNT